MFFPVGVGDAGAAFLFSNCLERAAAFCCMPNDAYFVAKLRGQAEHG